jgi:hypothetical protein
VEKILEICAVKIESNGLGLAIVMFIQIPCRIIFSIFEFVRTTLLFLYTPFIEFLMCGDFNVDYLLNDIRKQQLSILFHTLKMIHTVNFPTRLQNNHASNIDNVSVDESRLSSCIT